MSQYTSTALKKDMSTNVLKDMLKAAPPKHPVLQRLSAKLNDNTHTGNGISCYDRMHHRHNRT